MRDIIKLHNFQIMNIKNIRQKLHKLSYILLTLPLVGGVAGGLSSCSDWDDHYTNGSNEASNASLWEQIQSNPQLSDFAEVMKNIYITRQHKKTSTSYAELLEGGRSITVLAPVNGTFNKEEYIKLAQTNSGDSAVEKFFAMNHLISSPHSITDNGEGQKLILFNSKYANVNNNSINGVDVMEKNIRCNNGVLHVLKSPVPYSYTVYEALTNLPQFEGAGHVLKTYNTLEFNEEASVSNGSIDGVKIYVDSVTYERNKMLEAIGAINDIDSSYVVPVPTTAGWNAAWEKAAKAFTYPNTEDKKDSLQTYYAYRALMEDAIFSMTTRNKNQKDSITSVQYNPSKPEFHVFQKPYEQGGVLYNPSEIIECCNGKIYSMNNWSFDPTLTYHKKIEIEAETYENVKTSNLNPSATVGKVGVGTATGDSISKGGYALISGSSNWTVTYKMANTIASKYDIKLVILPISIVDKITIPKPCAFTATINYLDADGNQKTYTTGKTYYSDKLCVDTITVAEDFEFPVCNYDMNNSNVSISISANVGSRETGKYTRNMYLDAIVLTPKED